MIPKARLMATTSSTTASNKSMVVEKPSQEPLRCPRCDSSNTKFCYYNNYSLSQPRHFCKACKRYWTRGGTLRNVPVGGSCRKNNRVKHRQPSSNGGGDAVAKAAASAGNPSFLRPRLDLPHSSAISNSSLIYSLSSAANNMNTALEFSFPFSGLSSTKVSSDNSSSGLFDMNLHHHVTDLGIGFSSSSGLVENHLEFSNGFRNFIQDHSNINNPSSSSSSSPVFNNPILFGSSSAFSPSTSTTMASLLASTIQHQQKYANNGDLKDIETRISNLHQSLVPSYHEEKSAQENESGWNSNPNLNTNQYHIPQINPSDANSSLLWNPSNVNSAWFDPSNSNMGSSVPSLIN